MNAILDFIGRAVEWTVFILLVTFTLTVVVSGIYSYFNKDRIARSIRETQESWKREREKNEL